MYQYEVIVDNGEDYNILICATNDATKAKHAEQWAKDKGYTNVRISDINNLTKPDFIKTLNISK